MLALYSLGWEALSFLTKNNRSGGTNAQSGPSRHISPNPRPRAIPRSMTATRTWMARMVIFFMKRAPRNAPRNAEAVAVASKGRFSVPPGKEK